MEGYFEHSKNIEYWVILIEKPITSILSEALYSPSKNIVKAICDYRQRRLNVLMARLQYTLGQCVVMAVLSLLQSADNLCNTSPCSTLARSVAGPLQPLMSDDHHELT